MTLYRPCTHCGAPLVTRAVEPLCWRCSTGADQAWERAGRWLLLTVLVAVALLICDDIARRL